MTTNNHNNLQLQDLFQLDPSIIYLNHAAVTPWPLATLTAVQKFAADNVRFGSLHYPEWLNTEQTLKTQIQSLIHAPSPSSIALLKNTSEALSMVACGLNWQAGDNVVISNQEFPSNRVVWQSLQPDGVQIRQVELHHPDKSPEQCLIEACDQHTRLLSISAVQFGSGLRLDLERLGQYCRKHHILYCIDAIQQVGAVEFDVQSNLADFAMADGHKWMLGPEGLGFFYVRAEVMDQLRLSQFGWHMLANHLDFDAKGWDIAADARRFECGSPNMLGIHALSASLEVLHSVTMSEISTRVLDNTRYLLDAFAADERFSLLTPNTADRHAGIVTVQPKHIATEQLFQQLSGENIFCAMRGGGIRFSPHFHTPRHQLEATVDIMRSVKP